MIRTQIQLTEAQARALREMAAREGVSLAELIRRGVEVIVQHRGELSPEERRQRASAVVGRFRSRLGDLSTRHDDYLAEACPR